MKNIIFLGLTVALLAGCAQSPAEFSPGDNPKQYRIDEYECERDARSIRGDACDQMATYEKCMRAKGYAEIPGSAKKGLCAQVF